MKREYCGYGCYLDGSRQKETDLWEIGSYQQSQDIPWHKTSNSTFKFVKNTRKSLHKEKEKHNRLFISIFQQICITNDFLFFKLYLRKKI